MNSRELRYILNYNHNIQLKLWCRLWPSSDYNVSAVNTVTHVMYPE